MADPNCPASIIIRPFRQFTLGFAIFYLFLLGLMFIQRLGSSWAEWLNWAVFPIMGIVAVNYMWHKRMVFDPSQLHFINMPLDHGRTTTKNLSVPYHDIGSVRLLGDQLYIDTRQGKVSFPLKPQSRVATELQAAFAQFDITMIVQSSLVTSDD
ncbi:hypothetical protein FLM48_02800 [Shewanella sp. Scap07]|uniref:hypothetical protein n=1 Tax=Shewanella sp. Scap07 TaxID=2589987 RepID=UPI0015BBE8BE|nr:hypothetical protein [Shewanella sp. Scap07]QLE84107.1 hypothetical protein FLM48_02800 [Shewanella sp. Scap07]